MPRPAFPTSLRQFQRQFADEAACRADEITYAVQVNGKLRATFTIAADATDAAVKEAALGIIRIINSNMALAIRSNSVARGVDPREFSIMPFGGAGPLHGVALAEAMSCKDVIVPANTFWATAQAAKKAGARVVYADCNREDLCLSVEDLQRKGIEQLPLDGAF